MKRGKFVYDVFAYTQEVDYSDSMHRLAWAGTEMVREGLSRRNAKRETKRAHESAKKESDVIGYAYMQKRFQPEPQP